MIQGHAMIRPMDDDVCRPRSQPMHTDPNLPPEIAPTIISLTNCRLRNCSHSRGCLRTRRNSTTIRISLRHPILSSPSIHSLMASESPNPAPMEQQQPEEDNSAAAQSKKAAMKEAAKLEKERRRQQHAAAAVAASSAISDVSLDGAADPLADNYGMVPLVDLQSKEATGRVWTEVGSLLAELKDDTALVRGRLQTIHGVSKKMAFFVLREKGFTVQCVLSVAPNLVIPQMVKFVTSLNKESIVDVEGIICSFQASVQWTTCLFGSVTPAQ